MNTSGSYVSDPGKPSAIPGHCPGQVLELLALGTQNKVLIDPREVYSLALQQNACSIVAIHNHPSGRLKPSPADKSITQQLMKGSEFVNLGMLPGSSPGQTFN
ncbi:hypothetical protein LZZ85_13095 [Terrimonas sp. NA20]|uniref:MPN domain-containing protein n=1 Tax=Terrimonas ginsenosidimutans TaxID=2908004 RepID=A0ABS9KSD9_9BACT|nr:hypothetical protein [Terrimonas ginsenosidimutans]